MAAKLFVFLCLCFSSIQVIASMTGPIITVEQGQLSPSQDSDLLIFKGIPFAQPPVNELRWQPPLPPLKWQGVRQANAFENQCMQKYIYDDMRFRAKGTSEDCLYLNVWAPKRAEIDNKGLPVLVYFYGGGFRAGDGSEPRYDGAAMARQGIVVVTVNYRLGIFGLFAHPDLSAQSEYRGSGNYTFLDQHAALAWVSRNIQQFGGDPTRITIGGESAGSISVSALMASPLSKRLIAGAIGQSGAMSGPPIPAEPLEKAHQQGQSIAQKLAKRFSLKSNNIIAQLRQVPANDLLEAMESLQGPRLSPTVDGLFLTKQPSQLYADGHFSDVPVMAGVNSQEGAYGWILGDKTVTPENYRQVIKALYPEQQQQILALYPATTPEQIKNALQDLASDRFISFSTWNWLDQITQFGSKPTYYYVYDHIRPARKVDAGGTGTHNNRGAVHSAEIEYALGNLDVNPLYHWQPLDYQVSARLQEYFVRFIKTGNPNGPSSSLWPKMESGKHLLIGSKHSSTVSSDTLRQRYEFHRHNYNESQ